jgi:hypothetical protein
VSLDGIDALDLGNPVIDANRIEDFGKRYHRFAEVDLISCGPDVVIGVAVDDEYFDIRRRYTGLVTLARGAEGGPEPSKSSTEDNNARHIFSDFAAANLA